MKRLPYTIAGLKQAMGIVGYCAFVGVVMWKGQELFGPDDNYLGPVVFLMLFSTSALVCGLLVFYQPYLLFFKGKREEAASLVLSTAIWLMSFLGAALLAAAIY